MATGYKNWTEKDRRKIPLEEEMITLSSVLVWEIPWMEEPHGLYSPGGCKRVGHDLVTKQQQHILFNSDI